MTPAVPQLPTTPPQTDAPLPPPVFSARLQASLFAFLFFFLCFIAWRTWQPATPPAPIASAGRIDLNRADKAELMLLRGVGADLADRIIAHREKNGPFEGLNDLRKISGIGPATLEKLRPHVVLSWGESSGEPTKSAGASVMTISPAALSMKSSDTTSILDPNRATLEQLQTLPGIGPKLAQRIVEYRETKPFNDVSELRRVYGIGAKTLEKIRPRLQIGEKVAGR